MLNKAYPIHEIAIIGENAFEKALEIQRRFLPNKVISASTAPNDTLPLLADKPGAADALVYVCRDFACQRPVSSLEEFLGIGEFVTRLYFHHLKGLPIVMNMKYYHTLIIYVCSIGWLAAQQVPQYSLYALNPYAHNPAFAGLENTLVATGVYRQQWSRPCWRASCAAFNAHLPIYAISSGVGMRVENDVIGAHNTTQAILQLQLSNGVESDFASIIRFEHGLASI